MKFNCTIIDGELSSTQELKKCITDIPYLILANEYKNFDFAFNQIISNPTIHLVFLDIDIVDLNDYKVKDLIKEKFVITTGYDLSSAIDAFDLSANGFLLKSQFPFKLRQVVDNIFNHKIDRNYFREFIWIKCGPKIQLNKIYITDIIFIEGASNYVKIHTDCRTYITYLKMSDFENDIILRHGIFRVSKSYFVSKNHMNGIVNNVIILSNEHEIKIGNTYKSNVVENIKMFAGSAAHSGMYALSILLLL
jgi:DNA-binding LytR/AlgR family response regulator